MDLTSTIVSLRGASAFSEPDDMTEGDNDADEALAECAEAASYPSWAMTADDRSILFGRAAAPDGTLKTHPLEDMTDYQIMRVRAWHDRAARALPLTTRFKLVASYVATRDRDLPETIRLCNIARRAVRDFFRSHCLRLRRLGLRLSELRSECCAPNPAYRYAGLT